MESRVAELEDRMRDLAATAADLDIIWIIISAVLVFFMQVGFAMVSATELVADAGNVPRCMSVRGWLPPITLQSQMISTQKHIRRPTPLPHPSQKYGTVYSIGLLYLYINFTDGFRTINTTLLRCGCHLLHHRFSDSAH